MQAYQFILNGLYIFVFVFFFFFFFIFMCGNFMTTTAGKELGKYRQRPGQVYKIIDEMRP